MWNYVVRVILRNRFYNLIAILLITTFMGYKASQVQMSYEFAKMLPETDTTYVVYQDFKNTFGEDGSVFFIAIQDSTLFQLNKFNDWYDLTYEIKKIDGVQEVLSIAKIYTLTKNDSSRKFDFVPVISHKPESQQELDSLKNVILALPFYEKLLINKKTHVSLMAITLEKAKLNTKDRVYLIKEIKEAVEEFGQKHHSKLAYSGLPYIRTLTSQKVEEELKFFLFLALLVAAVILFLFFKSFKAVIFPMVIVAITVIWTLGTVSLLGYKISILSGVLPPLLIVIVVENCIFLLNKYHIEYKTHGNKVKSLSRVVHRIGNANLLTNATTAAGFAAFIITGNQILVEFGIVAAINIFGAYILSLFLIPIFFSYLAPPKRRHIKHLSNKYVLTAVEKITFIVLNRRKFVYAIALIVVVAAIIGVSRLNTTGNIVDDIPKKDPLYVDLLFMEKHFNGIMPFEISIDTRKEKGAMQLYNLKKIDRLQDTLASYPEFSHPLSLTEVVKFGKQAFYNGSPAFYELPNRNELIMMGDYIPELSPGESRRSILNSFVDTNLQTTRISVQMKNIGTKDIQRIKDDLRPKIDSIFHPDKYDVKITGTSVVFLKGSSYLVKNLLMSLLLAIIAISILMALLFTSFRMILVSLIPNLIPQLLTAAMMGYIGIPIKPSTILIFSIALGISVDNTIHFLSRYRLELKYNDWKIKKSVLLALKEAGFSMMYSSVVLFFGFAIFTRSTFGGTEAMGYLVSFTLLIAVLSNLFLLPSLLLSLDKFITTRSFREPLLDIFEEEEEEENLEYEKGKKKNTQ